MGAGNECNSAFAPYCIVGVQNGTATIRAEEHRKENATQRLLYSWLEPKFHQSMRDLDQGHVGDDIASDANQHDHCTCTCH